MTRCACLPVRHKHSGADEAQFYGAPFAMPGMGEKGYLDLVITVSTPGGHSSVPPPHTGIGIMSEIVAAVESHPFEQKVCPLPSLPDPSSLGRIGVFTDPSAHKALSLPPRAPLR